MPGYPADKPECLPGCDEVHADECPVPDWDYRYWGEYFGIHDGMTRDEKLQQLDRFRPPGREPLIEVDKP